MHTLTRPGHYSFVGSTSRLASIILAQVLLLHAVACGQTSNDRSAVEHQIRQSIEDWRAAANRGDMAGTTRIWAPGVQGWFPSATEFTNAAAFDDKVDARSLHSTYAVTINEVLVSTDLAVVRDTWEETLHAPHGQTARRVIQSFEVWQPQSDGAWKIARWISAPGPWQRNTT
jgi:ketosteroid isomerase-like protein